MKNQITIEEILANPNLDLSERISKYIQEGMTEEIAKELALTLVKQEYDFWAGSRENVSPRTDAMLGSILDGHSLTQCEAFEMMCDDPEKVARYTYFTDLKQRISDNNGITLDDLNSLCNTIGIDSKSSEQIRQGLVGKGLIIDSYDQTGSGPKM